MGAFTLSSKTGNYRFVILAKSEHTYPFWSGQILPFEAKYSMKNGPEKRSISNHFPAFSAVTVCRINLTYITIMASALRFLLFLNIP